MNATPYLGRLWIQTAKHSYTFGRVADAISDPHLLTAMHSYDTLVLTGIPNTNLQLCNHAYAVA